MSNLRFAAFGAGFWARYQLAAWQDVPGATCVALYNRTRGRAEALAQQFGIPQVYDDAAALLERERLHFVDIMTDVDSHPHFVGLAARHGLPVVCQKPMAPSLALAEEMVATCGQACVPLIIHENWRWQTPIRQLKALLDQAEIGDVFRARIRFSSGFPVFDNQPFLKELEQFLLTDIGSHILDVARYLFGDAQSLYCQTARVRQDIRSEDVATVITRHGQITCVCELSYASVPEDERFPETLILVEGSAGTIELAPNHWLRLTTRGGTVSRRVAPPHYGWADPAYDLVHASIVPCNAAILHALRTGQPAETAAQDNIKTVRMVFGAYQSSALNQVVTLNHPEPGTRPPASSGLS